MSHPGPRCPSEIPTDAPERNDLRLARGQAPSRQWANHKRRSEPPAKSPPPHPLPHRFRPSLKHQRLLRCRTAAKSLAARSASDPPPRRWSHQPLAQNPFLHASDTRPQGFSPSQPQTPRAPHPRNPAASGTHRRSSPKPAQVPDGNPAANARTDPAQCHAH